MKNAFSTQNVYLFIVCLALGYCAAAGNLIGIVATCVALGLVSSQRK